MYNTGQVINKNKQDKKILRKINQSLVTIREPMIRKIFVAELNKPQKKLTVL